MSKIYTRGGDKGQTHLVGGSRVSKADPRLEAYGDVDELNSVLGVCRSQVLLFQNQVQSHKEVYHTWPVELAHLQNHLFFIGSRLACEDEKLREQLPALPAAAIPAIEQKIDQWTALLAPLKEFILPGGHLLASELHVARTVCRRSERAIAALLQLETQAPIDSLELRYINRLSDYLFTAARFANLCFSIPDQTWKKDI